MENMQIRDIGVGQIGRGEKTGISCRSRKPLKAGFKKQLESSLKDIGGLKFSGHAVERLAHRGVHLTEERTQRLVSAVDAAEEKGARDSLVLLDDLAFVVSVKNRTVITACDTQTLSEGVFTKIDSAVLG